MAEKTREREAPAVSQERNRPDGTSTPLLAAKILGSLAILFGVSVGVIFGRLYLLNAIPDDMHSWADPVSFWVVVLILVCLLCVFVGIIYVLSQRQRQQLREQQDRKQ